MDLYCRGIKSVRRILTVAGDSILHQGLLQSHGPGIRGWNGNWDAATLLPQTWAKGAQVLLLQNQVESGFEMVWILEGRCGNFCSGLSHAFVIQKVECGSTPMLGLAYPIHQPKWDLSYRCLTRTRKRGIWVFLCMQKWRRKLLQVLKIIGPSCSAGGNAVAEDGWNLGHGKYFCVSFVAVFQSSQLVQNCCLSMTAWGSTKLFKSTSNSARSGIASIGWVPIQGQTCWNRNHAFQKNLFAICQLQLLYFCFWGKAKQKPWIFMPLCHFASYFSQDGCELSCGQRVEETSLQWATHPFSGCRWSTGFSAVSWRMATVCTVNLLRLTGKEVRRDPLDVWGLNLPSSSWSWRSLTRSPCEILHPKVAILDVFWCHMHQCHLLLLRSSNTRSAPRNKNSTPGTLYHRRYLSSGFQSRGLSFLRFAFALPLLQCRSGSGIGSATYQLQITSKETLAASWSNDQRPCPL